MANVSKQATRHEQQQPTAQQPKHTLALHALPEPGSEQLLAAFQDGSRQMTDQVGGMLVSVNQL